MTIPIRRVTKTAAATVELSTDFGVFAVGLRRPGVSYAVGDFAQPSFPNGTFLECISAGQTSAAELAWPMSGQIKDGTVGWAVRAIGAAGLPTITAAAWTGPGLTLSNDAINGFRVSTLASGGQIGVIHTVGVVATLSLGRSVEFRWKVRVE